MRTRTILAAAAAASALALVGAGATTASATVHPHVVDVLTINSTGGPNVNVNDQIHGVNTGPATFYSTPTGTTGVTCANSTFDATVLTNPAAPGTATESATGQTFTNCTTNVSGATGIKSMTVNNLPYNCSVTTGGTIPMGTGTVTCTGSIQTTVVINTLLGAVTCTYTGSSFSGTAVNADNSINFTNQHFVKGTGPSLCFTDVYFTVKYKPILDVTQGNAPVFVNP